MAGGGHSGTGQQKDKRLPAKSKGMERGKNKFDSGDKPYSQPRDASVAEVVDRQLAQRTNNSSPDNPSRGTPKPNATTKPPQQQVNVASAPRSTPSNAPTPVPSGLRTEKRAHPWGNGQQGAQKREVVQRPASGSQESQNSQRSSIPPAKAESRDMSLKKLTSTGSLPAGKKVGLALDKGACFTEDQKKTGMENAQIEAQKSRSMASQAELKENGPANTRMSAPLQRSAQLTQGASTAAAERPRSPIAADARGETTTPTNGTQNKVQATSNGSFAVSPVPALAAQPNGRSRQLQQSVSNAPKPPPKPAVANPHNTPQAQPSQPSPRPVESVKPSNIPALPPQSSARQPVQHAPPDSTLSRRANPVAPPKLAVRASVPTTQVGNELRKSSNPVGRDGVKRADDGKSGTASAAPGEAPKDKVQPAPKGTIPKMAPVVTVQQPTETTKDAPLSTAKYTRALENNMPNAETAKKALQPAGSTEAETDASRDTTMKDAPDSVHVPPDTGDAISKVIKQTPSFTPGTRTPRTNLTNTTASAPTPETNPTRNSSTPNAANPSASAIATATTTHIATTTIPTLPQTQTFTYTLHQKLYTELDNPSLIPSTPLSPPYTSLAAANAQAALLVAATKSFHASHNIHFSSVREFRDENDCLVFVGVGTNPAAGDDVAGRKNYCRIWVERRVVLGDVRGTADAAESGDAQGGRTEYICKTLFLLRLCKVIVNDSSDSEADDGDDGDSGEVRLEYIPLSDPAIRRLNVFSEVYTVRAQANSAARRLQIGLSHKKEPLKETERRWQEEENRRLMDKIHVLEGLDTVIGSGDESEEGEEKEKGKGKGKGKGRKKTEAEREAEKPARRRGCWESEFNGLGGERYRLWVERVQVCGPRNM
ncbi:uncharacterized protein EI97DRAFT_432077 [Westerdykella ornata]|uniref:Uncharacterized protein n=1 Tax=Westerdykella ornata TaxID=318751 RepID=A0A6A6JN88_WESOR|nr:uncharacterized protein EI97DRAFT_432077 [Westerdykella ornata]KAF2277987.1 hypothetical protein EI97DRAFT_432077 [Westerdykella ornata]